MQLIFFSQFSLLHLLKNTINPCPKFIAFEPRVSFSHNTLSLLPQPFVTFCLYETRHTFTGNGQPSGKALASLTHINGPDPTPQSSCSSRRRNGQYFEPLTFRSTAFLGAFFTVDFVVSLCLTADFATFFADFFTAFFTVIMSPDI
jgi:hypothetical protein